MYAIWRGSSIRHLFSYRSEGWKPGAGSQHGEAVVRSSSWKAGGLLPTIVIFFPLGTWMHPVFLPCSTISYISDKPIVNSPFSYFTTKTASHKPYLYTPSKRTLYLQEKSYCVAQGPECSILPLQLPLLSLLACVWLKQWMFHIWFRDLWARDKVSNILE